MKSIIKKIFITYLVVICCIYTPTAQAANWSFGGFNFGNGSLNIVKDGVKITTQAVESAPVTSNLGKRILSGAVRGANVLSALSIIVGLGEDAIDWVLDPANNAVKYKPKVAPKYCSEYTQAQANQLCTTRVPATGGWGNTIAIIAPSYYPKGIVCTGSVREDLLDRYDCAVPSTSYKTIPIPTVAQKIFDTAKSGNTNAQADVLPAVEELVNAGTYDTPINQAIQKAIDNGTLPKDTTTDPQTDPQTNPQIDTSSITAAIQSLASSFATTINNAFNAITSVINTSIDKILNKQDQLQGEVVNTGTKVDAVGGKVVGVGDKVDNVGGKVVGVGDAVKDVGGKVVGLNDSVDKVGDKVVGLNDSVDTVGDKVDAAGQSVGDKVTAGTDAVGTKVDAVGDKVTAGTDAVGTKVDAVGERVGTKVDEAAQVVGDKVTAGTDAVGTKVDAAGDKVSTAVKESTKEITDKMEQTKPKDFELPTFCSWASKVCDFIDWVKSEPDITDTEVPTIDLNDQVKHPSEFDRNYVSVAAQCPADVVRDIPLPDRSFSLVFAMSPVCDFASTYLRPVIIFLAYIYGALSIANAFRVGG